MNIIKHTTFPSGTYQALFYIGQYYLPVEETDIHAQLDTAVKNGRFASVQAIELSEKSETEPGLYELGVCIAPYFISEYLKEPETVIFEYPEEVYPVQIELLTQKEYNDRLREQVTKHCEGCRGFGSLNKNDSSLAGHFDEITLDGFCPYRWETRNSPRSFVNELESFGFFWGRYGYASKNADSLMDDIKYHLKLAYTSGTILDDENGRTLFLYSDKNTLIQTVLTDILADCVSKHWEEGYRIRLNSRIQINEEAVMGLLLPKKIAATRKELSKYGVMIGILEYDPTGNTSIQRFMDHLAEECFVRILHKESGRMICLFTGRTTLMRLRCASPVLEAYNVYVTVYDALNTVQYRICYDMPKTIQDAVQVDAAKANRLSKKILKAQEDKVLNYEQVSGLFSYVGSRLNEAGCDHTLKYTEIFLKDFLSPELYESALNEIHSMGGFCDCEVLMNCYEDYELE